MYINWLHLQRFRTFLDSRIDFVHPDQDFNRLDMPRPRTCNVNLLLGNNGSGKTALLKAIALACLGPAVGDSGIFPYRLVRPDPEGRKKSSGKRTARKLAEPGSDAVLEAAFNPHQQDGDAVFFPALESHISVSRRGDLELLRWTHSDDKAWHPIYSADTDAFFFVGYGATRRVESRDRFDLGSRKTSSFARAQRVRSLFEDAYSLIPLNAWLPELKSSNPGRFSQARVLINELLGKGHYSFQAEMEDGEYLFDKGGLKVPFPALSDGYRAHVGWIGDLLYHVCTTCPSGKKLVDNRGIVMVDEIDLHLHPKWQMTVLPTLANSLPNIQFIVTSHSPLVVGTLEWMNIIVMNPGPKQSSKAERLHWAVHGLDADQLLLTDFFGLKSTRAEGKARDLKALRLKARNGDTEAAKALLEQLSKGAEPAR
jgi:hypothetical protein